MRTIKSPEHAQRCDRKQKSPIPEVRCRQIQNEFRHLFAGLDHDGEGAKI